MRGVAALAVVTMHFFGVASYFTSDVTWNVISKFGTAYGHAGVDLFFTISGTIMYMIAKNTDANNVVASYKFVVHRVMRIYPLFWITFAINQLFVNPTTYDVRSLGAVLSLYAYPDGFPISWTLPYEVRFYLVVGIGLLVAHRHLDLVFIVFGLGQLIASVASNYGFIPANNFTYVLMTEFTMGLAVGALITRNVALNPPLLLRIGLVWLIASCAMVYLKFDLITPYRHLLYGLPSAIILYSIVMLERAGMLKIPALMVKIGNGSYSIYLWHMIVQYFVIKRLGIGHHHFEVGMLFFIEAAVITGVISACSFFLIERPSIRLGRLITRTRRARVAPKELTVAA
jgi:exopolysaccharide production protein ExoZ